MIMKNHKQTEKIRIIALDHKMPVLVTGKVIEIKEYSTASGLTAQCFLLKRVFVHKQEEYFDHVWCSFLKETDKTNSKLFANVKIDDIITVEGFSQKYLRKKTGNTDYSIRRVILRENHGNEYAY